MQKGRNGESVSAYISNESLEAIDARVASKEFKNRSTALRYAVEVVFGKKDVVEPSVSQEAMNLEVEAKSDKEAMASSVDSPIA